jgi:hypothetical protein
MAAAARVRWATGPPEIDGCPEQITWMRANAVDTATDGAWGRIGPETTSGRSEDGVVFGAGLGGLLVGLLKIGGYRRDSGV